MSEISSEIYLIFANASANSNKYWSAIAHSDGTIETTWGRVGYPGQTKTYNCGSYSKAINKLHSLAATKKQKGYKESQPQSQSPELLQIRRALQLLQQIRSYVQQRNFNEPNYLEALNEYLTIVPTPLGMKINPTTIYRNVAAVDHQVQLLQQLISPSSNTKQSSLQPRVQTTPQATSLKSLSKLFWKV